MIEFKAKFVQRIVIQYPLHSGSTNVTHSIVQYHDNRCAKRSGYWDLRKFLAKSLLTRGNFQYIWHNPLGRGEQSWQMTSM
jgi:hypothetical protein